jgi:hypothetical protein
MGFYEDWGFKGNPFDTAPLSISDQGSALLVGREKELEKIGRRLTNPSKLLTLEGGNGVGKTSLINVFLYRHVKEVCSINVGPLFVPCERFFQIDGSISDSDFKFRAFIEIANSIIRWKKNIETLRGRKKIQSETSLRRMINSPTTKDLSAGLGVLNLGSVSFGRGEGFNESEAFKASGLELLVKRWLLDRHSPSGLPADVKIA